MKTDVKLHLNNYGGNATTYALDGRVGSTGIPMLTNVATPAPREVDLYAFPPEATTTGIVCGHCSNPEGYTPVVRHASVDHVRRCSDAFHYSFDLHRAEEPLARAGIL